MSSLENIALRVTMKEMHGGGVFDISKKVRYLDLVKK
jgi:hypothetical protein